MRERQVFIFTSTALHDNDSTPSTDQQGSSRIGSEELASDLSPCRPAGILSPLLVDNLPIDLAATRVNVDFGKTLPGGTLPDPTTDVEEGNDEDGQVGLEEGLGASLLDRAGDSNIKLESDVSMMEMTKLRIRGTHLGSQDDEDQD